MGITEEHLKRITEQAAVIKALDEKYVDVSGELEALASDNAAMEAEIRGLEEANARLRERLNRGENHDAYMKLPLDADGEPIRIGDTVYTRDAEEYTVRGIYALADEYSISVVPNGGTCFLPMEPEGLTHRTTDSADSWEKLEEDLLRGSTADAYFQCGDMSCSECPHSIEVTGCYCWMNRNLDILARAKKLAGIEGETER